MHTARLLTAGTLIVAGLASGPTLAGGDSGPYVGVGVGQSYIGDIDFDGTEVGSVNFSGHDTAYKLIGGYNFGIVPLIDLGVEVNYLDFGKQSDNNVNVSADAFAAFGVAGVNFGPAGIFAKVGMLRWDAKVSSPVGSGDDNGTDPAYGVGARFHFLSFQLRGEYEYFDVASADDLSLLSASLIYTF